MYFTRPIYKVISKIFQTDAVEKIIKIINKHL
jgi:hypothetical protein